MTRRLYCAKPGVSHVLIRRGFRSGSGCHNSSYRDLWFESQPLPGGREVLPYMTYMGYIGMCGPKGYGFSAVLVMDRVSIVADFGHFGHK